MLHVPLDSAFTSHKPPAWAIGDLDALVDEITLRDPRDICVRLRSEWQALADAAVQPNSFAEPWFVEASVACFAPEGGVHLLAVRRGGWLIGVAAFAPASRYGRLPLRHVQNWRHHNHFFGPPLIRRGEEIPFWLAVLSVLDKASWASGFLHVTGLVENGPVHRALDEAAKMRGRTCRIVHRRRRPMLESRLSPEDYLNRNVSAKRRSEYRRLRKRLDELGKVDVRELRSAEEVEAWSSEFLELEAAGWKGKAGSAMAAEPATERFFRQVVADAFAAGRLRFLRLDLDARPLAMLTTLLAPPGAFGFKSAFDEKHARFAPGILLQIENLHSLESPDIRWTDSCAREDHPVASLWSEWRSLVHVNVRLSGVSRLFSYGGAWLMEEGARYVAALSGRKAA